MITGSSKGLGAELSKQLLHKNHHVICISRTENKELKEFALRHSLPYGFFSFDLSDAYGAEELLHRVLMKINQTHAEMVCLINNAANVNPLGAVETCNSADIINTIHLNMISPIILTSTFLRASQDWSSEKVIINISSGSGEAAAEGMSVYCSTKSAINMFTRSVQLEQVRRVTHTKIVAVDPGMIDTEMQAAARNADDDFYLKPYFLEAEKNGMLGTAGDAAAKIINNYIFT